MMDGLPESMNEWVAKKRNGVDEWFDKGANEKENKEEWGKDRREFIVS